MVRGLNRWIGQSQRLNGKFCVMRYISVASTEVAPRRRRRCLGRLLWARWRRPALERRTFPPAVILKRLATDFLVLMPLGRRINSLLQKSTDYRRPCARKQAIFIFKSGQKGLTPAQKKQACGCENTLGLPSRHPRPPERRQPGRGRRGVCPFKSAGNAAADKPRFTRLSGHPMVHAWRQSWQLSRNAAGPELGRDVFGR